ncbi:MAG: alkaline phosphatase family protein [Actinobacteria bacterium]|nr:alkaline phosphatase family protein [Actinomycetota bacterium]
MRPPDYTGGGLVNLVAELEGRLAGKAPTPGLYPDLAALVPDAATYLLVLLDGLGDGQLGHPAAAPFAAARRGALDAPFPTTTTVSLATIATGLPPARHGLIAYQLWLPGLDRVANTIKWTTLWGDPLDLDFAAFLPRPNTWERLSAAGVEPIVIQPLGFAGTPLSRVLYRGCRVEPYADAAEAVAAAVQLIRVPRRLVMLYLPQVDFAAHVWGQRSDGYAEAVSLVAGTWDRIVAALAPGAVLVGTADHGHMDIPKDRQVRLTKADHEGRTFYGDPRVTFVKGEGESLAARLPATWVRREEMEGWWGPGKPHPDFAARAPDGALFADPGCALLHRFSDDRLIGQHGGLTEEELRLPLLVAGS